MTVRPARKQPVPAGLPIMVDTSELHRRLAAAAADGAGRARLREVAGELRRERAARRAAGLDAAPLRAWFYANQDGPLHEADLDGCVARAYGRSLAELVEGADFAEARAELSDRLLTAALLGDPAGTAEQDLLDAKLLGLAATADAHGRDGSLGDVVNVPASLPDFFAQLPPAPDPVPAPPVPAEPDDEAAAWSDDLSRAHRELLRLVTDGGQLVFSSVTAAAEPGAAADPPETDGAEPRLSAAAVAGLSERTRAVLDRLGLLADDLRPFRAIPAIEAELHHAAGRVAVGDHPAGTLAFDGGEIDLHRFHRAVGAGERGLAAEPPPPAPQHSAAGLADLLVVRQKIKAYELGEFAHVENVMTGETRDRSTRRLTQVEVTTEDETETETEKERDLQSTERSELQNEAEKHVKSQLDIEAGLQVSGSYGPAASFSSSVKAGSSSSTEESQRKASSFSQEVTQRTAEKVRERVRSLVRRRTLEEFEETNRHAFTNGLAKHVRGVYRWLNKVYDAQVFNYGQRFMFDFVVPEPAAYFLYGLVENPPRDSELVKPQAPTGPDGQPLRPSQLTRGNYTEYVARYRVANAPAPPPSIRTATFSDKQDGTTTTNFGRAGKIDIPEGYAAKTVTVQATHLFEGGLHNFHIVVGGQLYVYTDIFGAKSGTASGEKEISISIAVTALCWSVGVDVECVLTPEAEARWQQSVYDAVIAAYQQQLAEYNERAAQRELQRSTNQQFGRNPLVNRRVERDELKKWVVMMLTKKADLNLDSFKAPVPGSPPEPVLDLDKANANGAFIRFLENAFEWQNMLYVCYPHLWGRRARWISALNITDPDADFAAFLRAGAARVQVPVRPGFESAVAYFVYTGNIWDGNDVPRINDDLYVPIIDEITTNLGKLDNGVPYPANSKPWEVIIPTDLVLVQDVSDVPPLRDALKPGATVAFAGNGHAPAADAPALDAPDGDAPDGDAPAAPEPE
ncbi:hypothetical protein, partial [Actinomadura fibrosa]